MNRTRFSAAALIALAAITGCSSKLELEFDNEEMCAAVRAEEVPASTQEWSRTRVSLAAERTIRQPAPLQIVEGTSPVVAEDPPASETRYEPVVVQPAQIITEISIGEVNIHVGDVVHVQNENQVENEIVLNLREPVFSTLRPVPRDQQPTSASQREADPRCERLLRQHETRVRQWNMLFERRQ